MTMPFLKTKTFLFFEILVTFMNNIFETIFLCDVKGIQQTYDGNFVDVANEYASDDGYLYEYVHTIGNVELNDCSCELISEAFLAFI